jgi:hypothetical protein
MKTPKTHRRTVLAAANKAKGGMLRQTKPHRAGRGRRTLAPNERANHIVGYSYSRYQKNIIPKETAVNSSRGGPMQSREVTKYDFSATEGSRGEM